MEKQPIKKMITEEFLNTDVTTIYLSVAILMSNKHHVVEEILNHTKLFVDIADTPPEDGVE